MAFFAAVGPLVATLLTFGGVAVGEVLRPASDGSLHPVSNTLAAIPYFSLIFVVFGLPVGYAIGLAPSLLSGLFYAKALAVLKPSSCPLPRVRFVMGAAVGLVTFLTARALHLDRYGPLSWLCLTSTVGTSLLIRPAVFRWLTRATKTNQTGVST
jgi:hypothetical protein